MDALKQYLNSPEGKTDLLAQLDFNEQNFRLEGIDLTSDREYQKLKELWQKNLITSTQFADSLNRCILTILSHSSPP